jgi:hypothetical protein
MSPVGGAKLRPQPEHRTDHPLDLYWRWVGLYGPAIAEQLDPDCEYCLIRIGAADFAFDDPSDYLRAMGEVWRAGVEPDPLPSALGRELADVAPKLQGVNPDLPALIGSDVLPPPGRIT